MGGRVLSRCCRYLAWFPAAVSLFASSQAVAQATGFLGEFISLCEGTTAQEPAVIKLARSKGYFQPNGPRPGSDGPNQSIKVSKSFVKNSKDGHTYLLETGEGQFKLKDLSFKADVCALWSIPEKENTSEKLQAYMGLTREKLSTQTYLYIDDKGKKVSLENLLPDSIELATKSRELRQVVLEKNGEISILALLILKP